MDRQRCMDFLRASLPTADLADYPEALFEAFVNHAIFLREAAPWCAALDEELFLHYVLCPRVNDEDLSLHRRLFYDALWPRVKDLSVEDAVLEVNRWCHEHATYEAQDDRTASPLTVYHNCSGRCGEESAFLVCALRSVGLPARQLYAPRWSHCDDNHAWVEVLCGNTWRFLGACEPEPTLDRGWFQTAAGRAVVIHSRTFGIGTHPLHGPLICYVNNIALYNQTPRYSDAKELTVTVTRDGAPAPWAAVVLQVLNEASLLPVARLTADENGVARIRLGKGDIWVSAALDGLSAEGLCPAETVDFSLALAAFTPTPWTQLDFRAPPPPPPPKPLSPKEKSARQAVLARGNALRRGTMDGWYGGSDPLLKSACGNWRALAEFLGRDENPLRRRLVETLSPKDLRDVAPATLEAWLAAVAPYQNHYADEIFDPYLLCPRVAFEGLALKSKPPAVARVLALRQSGVPARLRALDGAVEVWERGAFHTEEPEQTGILRLTPPPGAAWSLSRQAGDGWQLLHPSPAAALPLPVGTYRAVTAVRLPSGDQLAAMGEFTLFHGQTLALTLPVREFALGDMLYRRPLPPILAEGTDNALAALAGPTLLLWPEVAGEPTEHILNELAAMEVLPPTAFFLPGPAALNHPTLSALLAAQPQIKVFFDDWAYNLETLSRLLGTDPDRPPLAILYDGRGHARYADSGYRVGAAVVVRVFFREF